MVFNNQMLSQTLVEQYMYQSALGNQEEMIQLCTHVLVSDRCFKILGNKPIPLDEIHTTMIAHNQKQLTKYQRKLELLEQRLKQIHSPVASPPVASPPVASPPVASPPVASPPVALIANLKEMKLNYMQIIQQAKARLNIFKNLESKLQETCAICMEAFQDVIPVVGQCGHMFCSACLSTMFESKIEVPCPMCRKPLIRDKLLIVKKKIELTGQEKYGTKMSNLIKYLNQVVSENEENRIIVFSQWDRMLNLISKVLEEQQIKFLLVKGSAFQSAAKIRKFKLDKEIRIILLSSEKASSGLNLTETSHIALVDTFNGEKYKVHAIEDQAIGRSVRLGQTKQVQVTRFVVKNTIEEDFYNQNILLI